MLGRLKMAVDECIDAYTRLADLVFVKKGHRLSLTGKVQARYDSDALESVIKAIVVKAGFDEQALLWDPEPHTCKVCVFFLSICHPSTGWTSKINISPEFVCLV
jgi:hypothetical protein